MPTDRRTSDLARTIALGTTAFAMVGVPTLGPLVLKTRENAERYDTAITPPGYAFAVWAPIFAGVVANAAQAALPNRSGLPENRTTGWPLAGAYALNTAWSVAAQSELRRSWPRLRPEFSGQVHSNHEHHRCREVSCRPRFRGRPYRPGALHALGQQAIRVMVDCEK